MKKVITRISFLILILASFSFTTTTSSTSRGLNIDGNVSDQKGATNGANGSSWELNEVLPGKSTVNWYVSWDNTNLYVGREGGNNGEPVLIYVQAEFSGSTYTDNSTGTTYDGTKGNFPTTGSPNWDASGGINFVAYIKNTYDEFRTWNGSWSAADNSLSPAFAVPSSSNMEVSIPWNSVSQGNGTPTHFRIILFHTNGTDGGSGAYVYGSTPNNSNTPTDGNQSTATFRSWWGGYAVTSGIAPSGTSDASLPVELTSFNVSALGKNVQLRWNTATETNNAGFEVERSEGGMNNWTKVDFVDGHGTTNVPQSYSYIDSKVTAGTYSYRLKQIDRDGKFEYSNTVEVNVGLTAEDFHLSQNYPNPFNPSTKIQFAVRQSEFVSLKVYNALGQEVKTLFNGIAEANTLHKVEFDGSSLPSGVYFYSLKTKDRHEVKKLSLMK